MKIPSFELQKKQTYTVLQYDMCYSAVEKKGGKQRTRDYSGGEQVVREFKESRDEAVFSLPRHSA